MKVFLKIVATAIFAGLPAMAVAQGAMNGPAPYEGFRFGQCLARFSPEATDALLQTDPGTAAEAAAHAELLPFDEHRCVGVVFGSVGGLRLHVPLELLRGYLAQTRYLSLYPDRAPASIAAAQPGAIDQQILINRLAAATDRAGEMVRLFSDCVVAARPTDVDALIRTRVRSDAEGAAMSRLGDSFAPCAWEGQTIQFTPEMLRSALAASLYRKAQQPTIIAATSAEASE